MSGYEMNFDGLVGPTHHYAGLSYGNEASTKYSMQLSNPKLAAKQGLLKMKALSDLGLFQGVLAPQERPDLASLRRLGFSGNDQQVIAAECVSHRVFYLHLVQHLQCGQQMLQLFLPQQIVQMVVCILPLQI
jgi:succinylarginine dihydrolase